MDKPTDDHINPHVLTDQNQSEHQLDRGTPNDLRPDKNVCLSVTSDNNDTGSIALKSDEHTVVKSQQSISSGRQPDNTIHTVTATQSETMQASTQSQIVQPELQCQKPPEPKVIIVQPQPDTRAGQVVIAVISSCNVGNAVSSKDSSIQPTNPAGIHSILEVTSAISTSIQSSTQTVPATATVEITNSVAQQLKDQRGITSGLFGTGYQSVPSHIGQSSFQLQQSVQQSTDGFRGLVSPLHGSCQQGLFSTNYPVLGQHQLPLQVLGPSSTSRQSQVSSYTSVQSNVTIDQRTGQASGQFAMLGGKSNSPFEEGKSNSPFEELGLQSILQLKMSVANQRNMSPALSGHVTVSSSSAGQSGQQHNIVHQGSEPVVQSNASYQVSSVSQPTIYYTGLGMMPSGLLPTYYGGVETHPQTIEFGATTVLKEEQTVQVHTTQGGLGQQTIQNLVTTVQGHGNNSAGQLVCNTVPQADNDHGSHSQVKPTCVRNNMREFGKKVNSTENVTSIWLFSLSKPHVFHHLVSDVNKLFLAHYSLVRIAGSQLIESEFTDSNILEPYSKSELEIF